MNHVNILLKIAPELKEAIKNRNNSVNDTVYNVLSSVISIDNVLSDAFAAYSKFGYVVIPQPHTQKTGGYNKRFDWSLIDIIRKTGNDPTEHQIIQLDFYIFLIQYMISGGFKKQGPFGNESLLEEFEEARCYMSMVKPI